MEKMVLLGCGGHAKSVVDTLLALQEYEPVGFLDKHPGTDFTYRGIRTIGSDGDLQALYASGVRTAFVCAGYMGTGCVRQNLYRMLKEIGYRLPALVDRTAVLAEDAAVGEGTYVGKRAVLGAQAQAGRMCIINTGAILEHDCQVGDHTHMAVGSVLCGGAAAGDASLIGAGAVVLQNVRIGSGCIVGAGAVVRKPVLDGETAVGNPARILRRKG